MVAKLRKVSDLEADHDLLREAAEVIRAGGIVAFPTETVYALAVAADSPDALERLKRAKGRDEAKPFQLLVSGIADVEVRVSPLPDKARALMERFWPGPLTVVIQTGGGAAIGFRAPAHPIAQAVLRLAGGVVVATSANRSGDEPLTNGEEILRQFGEWLELVLDGEPPPLQTASTVVRLDEEGLTVLRKGPISQAELDEALRMRGEETPHADES